MIPRLLLLLLFFGAPGGVAVAMPPQAVLNQTPGIGKNNHTAYVFAPFQWQFGFPLDKLFLHVSGDASAGQRYSYDQLAELKQPDKDHPALTCTVASFAALVSGHKDDMGILVIFTHGTDVSFAVEPFGKDSEAGDRARKKLADYIKSGEFKAEELRVAYGTGGWYIAVTSDFITNRRQLGQALVVLAACEGSEMAAYFTKASDQNDRPARVALGPTGCPNALATFSSVEVIFLCMDGQCNDSNAMVNQLEDDKRVRLRVLTNAVAYGMYPRSPNFVISGQGNTTLAPALTQGNDSDFPCPAKDGDIASFVFDTTMDTSAGPGSGDVQVTGIKVGDPKWKEGSKNILEIPIAVDPNALVKTYSIRIKGTKLKSAQNIATLDGNTYPNRLAPNGTGLNAFGPANPPGTPKENDDYFVKFENCKRVH